MLSLPLFHSSDPTLPCPSETHVFAHTPSLPTPSLLQHATMLFREAEAWTLILPRHVAESHRLDYDFPCRQVTLNVHSSLDAVGFLAAVTSRLVETCGVGINPVSGFYHDHLFVPVGREGEVVEVLREMAREAREES